MLSHIRRAYHSNCAGGGFKATSDEEMTNAKEALKTLLAKSRGRSRPGFSRLLRGRGRDFLSQPP